LQTVAAADRIDIVRKHDSHFYTTSMLVIGALVVVTIILFAFSRLVAERTQEPEVFADSLYRTSVEARIRPLVRLAVAGQDNTALVIQGPPQTAAIALEIPQDGPALYEAVCKTCHLTGLVGSPKLGDRANWAPRIAQGRDTLYLHAIAGYTGTAGVMPAKGGRTDLSDDLVKASVDYMVSQSQ
jgi:cytochrome c5